MKKAYPQAVGIAEKKNAGVAAQTFAPWNTRVITGRYALLSSLVMSQRGFKLPLTLRERLFLRLSQLAEKVDVLENSFVFRPDDLQPHWRLILNFLHREGIIKRPGFSQTLFANDGPKFPSISIDTEVGTAERDGKKIELYGFGAAETFEEAASKATGELLERFFLHAHNCHTFFSSTTEALGKKGARFLDPESLPSFKSWQKKAGVNAYAKGDELAWVTAEDLHSGESLAVPAQLVFWNYDTRLAQEPTLGYHTTNGGGGHFTREDAYLSAIYETIQRDGFLIYWLNNLSPAVIDVASALDEYPALAKMLDYLERYHIRPIFLNTTSDLKVPSLICAIIDENGKVPLITIGGGTGFDFEAMALSALYEAVSVNQGRRDKKPFTLPTNYEPFIDESIKRSERLSLWQGDKFVKRFNFFVSGKKQSVNEYMGELRAFRGEAEELAYTLSTLENAGYRVYGYEVKNDVLKKLGYHVVKAIIPGLIPLYLQENLALLGAERLRTVPEKLGYAPAKEPNPWPHLFP